MDDAYILGWEIIPNNVEKVVSKKLKLALQKKNILIKEIGRLHRVIKSIKKDSKSKQSCIGDKFEQLENDPFIIFYLKVYRELCGKTDVQSISKEASQRWYNKKRKPRLPQRKRRTNTSKLYGAVWELVLRGKSLRDIPRQEQDKLKMALIKNKIVLEEMNRLMKFVKRIRKEKKCPNTFIKIYLNVFREMCGKSNEQEMKEEAIKIWSKTVKKTNGKGEEESKSKDEKGSAKSTNKQIRKSKRKGTNLGKSEFALSP